MDTSGETLVYRPRSYISITDSIPVTSETKPRSNSIIDISRFSAHLKKIWQSTEDLLGGKAFGKSKSSQTLNKGRPYFNIPSYLKYSQPSPDEQKRFKIDSGNYIVLKRKKKQSGSSPSLPKLNARNRATSLPSLPLSKEEYTNPSEMMSKPRCIRIESLIWNRIRSVGWYCIKDRQHTLLNSVWRCIDAI